MARHVDVDVDVAGYLARLGLADGLSPSPSVEGLHAIHRAHVERVPYETLWIHLGEGQGLDVAESARRIVARGRGGYCFHLNGGLSALLGALGYRVTRHVGAVHGPGGPTEDSVANHLVRRAVREPGPAPHPLRSGGCSGS